MRPLRIVTANLDRLGSDASLLASLKASGFDAVRFDALAHECVRATGKYAWERLDARIALVVDAGLRPVLNMAYDLDGGKRGVLTPLDRATFAQWFGATANRYSLDGAILAVWNEPDHPGFWEKPNPVLYTALVRECVAAARRTAKNVPVWAGDLAYPRDPGFIDACLREGLVGADGVGTVSFHPYAGGASAKEALAFFPSLVARCNGARGPLLPTLRFASTEYGVSEAWIDARPEAPNGGPTILPALSPVKEPWRSYGAVMVPTLCPFGTSNGVRLAPIARKPDEVSAYYHRLFAAVEPNPSGLSRSPEGWHHVGAWFRTVVAGVSRRMVVGLDNGGNQPFDIGSTWEWREAVVKAVGDRQRLFSCAGPAGDMERWEVAHPVVRPVGTFTDEQADLARKTAQIQARAAYEAECERLGLVASGWYCDRDSPDEVRPESRTFGLFDADGRGKMDPAIALAARSSQVTI